LTALYIKPLQKKKIIGSLINFVSLVFIDLARRRHKKNKDRRWMEEIHELKGCSASDFTHEAFASDASLNLKILEYKRKWRTKSQTFDVLLTHDKNDSSCTAQRNCADVLKENKSQTSFSSKMSQPSIVSETSKDNHGSGLLALGTNMMHREEMKDCQSIRPYKLIESLSMKSDKSSNECSIVFMNCKKHENCSHHVEVSLRQTNKAIKNSNESIVNQTPPIVLPCKLLVSSVTAKKKQINGQKRRKLKLKQRLSLDLNNNRVADEDEQGEVLDILIKVQ